MKLALSTMILALITLLAATSSHATGHIERRVVSLLVTHQKWDDDRPWTKKDPSTTRTSAVIVEGPRLLTTAQMVARATLIQVERHGDARLWAARVAHVDPEVNLALIEVDDPAFFEGLESVRFARKTPDEGEVETARWHQRRLESTPGQIQTFETETNRYGNLAHVTFVIQTDVEKAWRGNPVLKRGKLVGITTSQEDQRVRVIPIEFISAYLERLDRDAYVTSPSIRVYWQRNSDRYLSRFLGQSGEPTGIVIRDLIRGQTGCAELRPRDILLSLDGHEIDSAGNYEHDRFGRLGFQNIAVEGHEIGDVVKAAVLRAGRELELDVELRGYTADHRLIPWRQEIEPPPFLVAAGLVFREFDGAFLRTWGDDWRNTAPRNLMVTRELDVYAAKADRRRIVVISGVLPDRYNVGYHDVANLIVARVNGRPIDRVRDVHDALQQPEAGADGRRFHVVEFAPNYGHRQAVFDAAEFDAANRRILETYGVSLDHRFSARPAPALGPPCGSR